MDLLATKLGGSIAVRPVDSRTVLNAWRKLDSGADSDGRAMARDVGAGHLVQGELVSTGARTTLSASLRQVSDNKETARVTVEGPSDSLTPLIDQLAARLLARAAGQPEERLPALAATTPQALRAYLDGWALLRRNQGRDARARFEAAVAADSSFALGALGYTRAAVNDSWDREDPTIKLAWRLRDRLTPGDRAYLTGMVGPRYPQGSTPREYLEAAELASRMSPGNADTWFGYAIYACFNRSDSQNVARCRSAIRRALELDSLSVPMVGVVVEQSRLIGDTATLRRAIRQFARLDSTSPHSLFLQWSSANMLGDTAEAHRLALSDSMVSTGAEQVGSMWQMVAHSLSEGYGFADVQAALRRSLAITPTGDPRASGEMVEHRLEVARGRSTGLPPISWSSDEYRKYDLVLAALFADGDPAPAGPAARALEQQLGSPMSAGCCVHQFAAAQAALESGRLAVARRALRDMARFARPGVDEDHMWALIVSAQIAARERSASAATELRRLDSTLTDWRDYMDGSLLYGNLIAARLFEQRGDYAAALRAIRRRFGDWVYPEVVSYHRDEGRIAAEAGDTAGAIRAYERYLRIRADPEPRLQPQLQQVRAELAALRASR